jgi:hypothetical protein
MLDLDDTELERVRQIVNHLPTGAYVIQKSSENSYNVISLNPVDIKSEVAEKMANVYEEDAQHFKIGFMRDKWVTRLGVKGDKTPPEFVELVINGSPEEIYFSENHVELFCSIYPELYELMPCVTKTVEAPLERIKYPTRAEKKKEEK